LRLFYGDPFRRALLVLLFVPGVAAAGVGALTAPFLLRVLLVPTSVYGLLFAASGLMGLAGSVLAGRLLSRDGNPRIVLLACNAGAVVSTMLLPLASGPLPVAIGSAVLGISLPTFFGSIGNVALTPVIVADVAEDAMGRTIAALLVIGGAAGLIGALAGGAAGQWIGVRSGLWLLDVAALVGVGVCLPGAVRAARGHQDTSISPEPVSSGERPHQDR
jgi:MFS family permease